MVQVEKLVVCMKWGSRYPADYVNRLWRAVRRNVQGPLRLVCFTDDATAVDPAVDCRPLPAMAGVPEHLAIKPWRKLTLWRADLGEDLLGREALFLDLDVVVTGSLDVLWEVEQGKDFVVWKNPTKPASGVGNTSVFRFKVGSHPEICDRFMADPEGVWCHEFRIEQEMIAARLGDGTATRTTALATRARHDPFYAGLGVMGFFADGLIVSFKEDVLPCWPLRWWQVPKLPVGARVVVFHGRPDPDEARDGRWPAKGWKKIYKTLRPAPWIGEHWG